MKNMEMIKTGTAADAVPLFKPAARGMFLVLERNSAHEMKEEDYLAINMHAQKELSRFSRDFEQAQRHWAALPKTEERQLSNLVTEADRLEDDGEAEKWIRNFASYEGLIYIFSTEGEIDFTTGKTREPIPVFGFSPARGIEFLDDLKDKDCMHYRIYYAYAEKQ